MAKTMLHARESVAFDEVLTIRDSNGAAVNVTGMTLALALQRQAGAIEFTLGMAASPGDQGFEVVDGPAGALRMVIDQATLAGVLDTTGDFTLFGDLLGTPSGGDARFVADVRLQVTTAGMEFGGSTYSVVLDAVVSVVLGQIETLGDEKLALLTAQADRAEDAALQLSMEPISVEPSAVLSDDDNNLLARISSDTIDHPNIERLTASTLLGIGSSRPLRAPSTPIATPIPFTGLTHLIKEGQSNSVNTGDALGLPAYDPPAMMFNGGVHSRRGYGDTETSATTGSRRTSLVPLRETGTETGMGPAMEMMLQLLREEDGVDLSTSDLQLLGSSVGVGGTKIEQIASTYYFRLEEDVAAAKALADADGRGYSVAAVLPNGHESNQLNTPPTLAGAMVPTTEANYLAVQREFRAQIEATVQAASGQTWPVPMFIVQTNTHLSSASANYYNENAYVAKAQLAAGLNADGVDPNIFFCGPTYQFALAADGVHFTSIGGAVRDALLGIAMKRVLFDGVKPKLLVPDMTIHANTTRLTFPEGPFNLRWDTTTVPEQEDYGIWMFDDAGARQSIPAPRLVDRNVVEIGRVALSGYRIANAMGTTTGGTRGLSNLRDNQGDRIVFAPGRFNHPMHNWVPLFERIVE